MVSWLLHKSVLWLQCMDSNHMHKTLARYVSQFMCNFEVSDSISLYLFKQFFLQHSRHKTIISLPDKYLINDNLCKNSLYLLIWSISKQFHCANLVLLKLIYDTKNNSVNRDTLNKKIQIAKVQIENHVKQSNSDPNEL